MAKRKEKEIPHIIIEESPANDLYLVLDGLMTGGAHLARQAFEAIRDEGKEFTQKAESKEFKSMIGSDLFQDNEKVADFLSGIESILRREPRLLAAAEVVAKYLREMKSLNEIFSDQGAAKHRNVRARKRKPSQESDFFYFLLGLFSLARSAVTSSEMSEIFPSIINSEENPAGFEKASRPRATKTLHTGPGKARSRLLR